MKLTIQAAPGVPVTTEHITLLLETAARNIATFPGAHSPMLLLIRTTSGMIIGTLTIDEEAGDER